MKTIGRHVFALLSGLGTILLALCSATAVSAQTYTPVVVNDVSGNQAMFHFDVNGESVAVYFYCGTGPSDEGLVDSGSDAGQQNVPCTDVMTINPNGSRTSVITFPKPLTVTIGSQTITINPATFVETKGACRCGWAMQPGYNVSITVGGN